MEQNRFKSVVTWTSIAALVIGVLVQCGVLLPEQGDVLKGTVSGVCQALVVFGILNNPTDRLNF